MSLETEIWKEVPQYENLYMVSNFGRVKNTRILKDSNMNFYRVVCLIKDGVRKTNLVHRLVGLAFIPNPENKPCINHKNGIKTDNRLQNLEWVTHSENKKHAFKIGLESKKGEKHHLNKLTEIQAKEIKYENLGLSQYEIAKKYNIDQGTVSHIRTSKNWTHI